MLILISFSLDDVLTLTTSMRFDKKFYCVFSKNNIHSRKLHSTFDSPEKLALLFLLKEVKPSPNRKMIKLLTFNNLFLPLQHSY